MANDPILDIPQIAENQANKYITHNNAVNFLAQAMNSEYLNNTASGATIAVAVADFTRNLYFVFQGATGNKDITFPSIINGANQTDRVFVVKNDTTFILTIKAATGAGTSVVLAPGRVAMIHQKYEDMRALFRFDPANGVGGFYDMGGFFVGAPGNAMKIFGFTAVRAFVLEDNFAGARGRIYVNPTATVTLDVYRNTTAIGTISINTAGVFTFATTGSGQEAFAVGDTLRVDNQATADATAADISITFKGLAS